MGKKIGLVVMFKLDAGGGAPRLVVDLIKDLNFLGYKVFLLTPFELNYQKIEEIYEPINMEKVYNVGKLKKLFCQNSIFGRKIIKKEFLKMVQEVDFIIDIDGGILHEYLPKDFDKSRYIVWRFAGVGSQLVIKIKKSPKRKMKDFLKKILGLNQNKIDNPLSKDYKIYPIDEWTKKRLAEKWGLSPEETLFHSIHTDEFLYKGQKKKDQIVILARIAPNKMIEDSIEVFSIGTKKHQNYKLVIMGGITSDSEYYIKRINEIIKNLGISERVKIIEQPPYDKLKQILIDSKVLIDSQRDISLTMGPVEAMAAGNIILAHKTGGTYEETLKYGEFGFGFNDIKDGGEKLEMILDGLKEGTINNKKSIKRSDFVSQKNFIKRLKEVIA